MRIIASPGNYNEAISLIENNVDVLLLGNNKFAVRNVFNCSLEDIKKLVDIKQNTEIWVNVNSFFYEPQIEDLENYLEELAKLKIDRIVFNDFAVPQINDEKQLNLKLHYDPNTLVTSYGQFEFYVENQFSSVSLSNELFLMEIKTILENKIKPLEVCMQAHGFSLIMHSRWNLVTNFQDYIEDRDDEYIRNKILYIREEQRKYENLIFEDEHGTHMFSGYELCLIKQLKQLYDLNLDYIQINNILQDSNSNYSLNVFKVYKKAIDLIKNNQFDENVELLWEKCKNLAKDKEKINSGFVGGIKEIKHYENI